MAETSGGIPPEQQFELAKYEARWSTYKAIGIAFVGTAAVGLFTAVVNWQIQSTKLRADIDNSRRSQEQSYLNQFISEAMHTDFQRRIDFAYYIASVTFDPEMKAVWKEYHDDLEENLTSSRKDLENKLKELNTLKNKSDQKNMDAIAALEAQIDYLRSQVTPSLPLPSKLDPSILDELGLTYDSSIRQQTNSEVVDCGGASGILRINTPEELDVYTVSTGRESCDVIVGGGGGPKAECPDTSMNMTVEVPSEYNIYFFTHTIGIGSRRCVANISSTLWKVD